jgi:hypothetical protein
MTPEPDPLSVRTVKRIKDKKRKIGVFARCVMLAKTAVETPFTHNVSIRLE